MPRGELKPDDWFEELDKGLDFRRRYGLEDQWAKLEKLYHNVDEEIDEQSGPNLVATNGDSLQSQLGVPFPYITVKARRADCLMKARIQETVFNSLVEDMEMREEVHSMILYTYLWGVSVLKIGFDSEFGWAPRFDIQGGEAGMTMSQVDDKGRLIEYSGVKPGMPWVAAVCPHDIVVPWGTRRLKDAPWIAHRVIRHVDEVKGDQKYSKTRYLKPVMSMEDFVRSYTTVMKPYRAGRDLTGVRSGMYGTARTDFVELWEIHDKRTQRIIVLATAHDEFLRNDPDLLQAEGLPFVELKFVSSRNFWTTSNAYYLLAHQAEATDIAKQATKHRRLAILKMIYGEEAFDEDELDKLLSSEVGAAAKVRGGRPLSEAVAFVQPPPNIQLYQEEEKVRRDSRESVGFSRNQMGEYETSGRRTAREVQEVSEFSNLRMSRRQNEVASVYVNAFRKIGRILRDNWRMPRLTQVLDQDGIEKWVNYDGSAFDGDFDYKIGFSNEGTETRGSRIQRAMNFFMFLAQDPTVDPIQLRRFIANEVNDPAFSMIFKQGVLTGNPDADVSLQMQQQQMPQGGGAGSPNGGTPAGSRMSGL